MMIKRTLLVVDDDREVATALCRHLEKDAYRVFVAHDALMAVALIRRKQPDVLLLDRCLMETDGVELHRILASQREMAVIVLYTGAGDKSEPTDPHRGISKPVGKPLEFSRVLSWVRAELRKVGEVASKEPKKMQIADIVIDRCSHEVHVRGDVVHLTPTEFKLMEVPAGEPGRAFTRLEILGRVFDCDYAGLERTVDTHVKNLRRKIEPDPADPTYIETVYGVGYRFTGVEREI